MNGKIALYTPNLGGGGAQRVILNLARGLLDRGFDVDIVAAGAAGPLLDDIPGKAGLIDLRSNGAFASLPRLVRYLRRERPRAMLSTMSHCNVVAIMAKSISRVRTRLVVREANTLTYRSYRNVTMREKIVFYLMMMFYSKADVVVANSSDTASDLVTNGITGEDGVVVIHNPIVSPELVARQKDPADHPWLRDTDVPVILGIGRLHPQKDYETLIAALAEVKKSRDARLMILGEGPEREHLEHTAQAKGIEAHVDMPGFVANPHSYLAGASVLAVSSRWEGFGNVLVEALAAGTPVVSTDCPGGPAEILDFGRFGRLVPVGDASAMARAIMETLDDPPDAGLLMERSRDFSIDTITGRYAEVLGLL